MNTKVGRLERDSETSKHDLETASGIIKRDAQRFAALESKAEFLERFLTYKNDPGGPSRMLFVDFVCALWKNTEDRRVRVTFNNLELSSEQILSGLSPELRNLLASKGVPPAFLDPNNFRGLGAPGTIVARVSPGQAIAQVQRIASTVGLAKVIQFFDGTTYQVPPEIALAVHTEQHCAPH